MNIARTNKTPEVKYDESINTLFIKGLSIPENSQEFYDPIINWIDDRINNRKEKLILRFQLDYYNTMSNISLLAIFKLFKNNENGQIIWMYDESDEEIGDAGRDFLQILNDTTNFTVEEI